MSKRFEPGDLIVTRRYMSSDVERIGVVRVIDGNQGFCHWRRSPGHWSKGDTWLPINRFELYNGSDHDAIWAEYCVARLLGEESY